MKLVNHTIQRCAHHHRLTWHQFTLAHHRESHWKHRNQNCNCDAPKQARLQPVTPVFLSCEPLAQNPHHRMTLNPAQPVCCQRPHRQPLAPQGQPLLIQGIVGHEQTRQVRATFHRHPPNLPWHPLPPSSAQGLRQVHQRQSLERQIGFAGQMLTQTQSPLHKWTVPLWHDHTRQVRHAPAS